MGVRAKFRCHSITLTQAATPRDGVKYDYETRKYVDAEGKQYTQEEALVRWEQPTVQLYAVTGGSNENYEFFTATPSAECKLTISNPKAAEFFELGGEYYLDFTRATADQ